MTGNDVEYTYGTSGNETGRFLFWTEDCYGCEHRLCQSNEVSNRMHAAVDEKYSSYYVYDHSGERRVKLTGTNDLLDVNADYMYTASVLKEPTIYPSAYMVMSNKGYTKHYYAGTERVAARIGGGGLNVIDQEHGLSDKSGSVFKQSLRQINDRILENNDIECIANGLSSNDKLTIDMNEVPERLQAKLRVNYSEFRHTIADAQSIHHNEPDVYFYHSDHLGSASWITDNGGLAVQHLQYLPYGERYVDQRISGYSERFTFTGKERDEETGYGYFGARYMDHELMTMWLSVDPMSDKYPSISPYAYCAWNPVRLIDPDGREAVDDWVKNRKTGMYKWNDNATSPDNTPDGYSYVGNDDALLRDLNVRTNYETKEDCVTGYSPDMGSNYVGFKRSRNCNDATIKVGVHIKDHDPKSISPDNSNGITFDGINIYGFVNQWSKTADGKTNTIIYNGIIEVVGDNGFRAQSSFSRSSEPCYSPAGTIPMQATVHIPASVMYNTILTNVNIKLGHASASLFNSPKSFSWPLLLHSVIH